METSLTVLDATTFEEDEVDRAGLDPERVQIPSYYTCNTAPAMYPKWFE